MMWLLNVIWLAQKLWLSALPSSTGVFFCLQQPLWKLTWTSPLAWSTLPHSSPIKNIPNLTSSKLWLTTRYLKNACCQQCQSQIGRLIIACYSDHDEYGTPNSYYSFSDRSPITKGFSENGLRKWKDPMQKRCGGQWLEGFWPPIISSLSHLRIELQLTIVTVKLWPAASSSGFYLIPMGPMVSFKLDHFHFRWLPVFYRRLSTSATRSRDQFVHLQSLDLCCSL